MRILVSIFFLLLLETSVNADTYYVATTGNNSNDGSIGSPWLTFHYAVTQATAGDTVYFRGGTYNHSTVVGLPYSGTPGNYICFFNYPGETPIFDCSTFPEGLALRGITVSGRSYIKFKGLTVNNLTNINLNNGRAVAFYASTSQYIYYEQCNSHHCAGPNFQCHNSRSIYYINCDVSWSADPQLTDPGNGGMGFTATGYVNRASTDTISYYGCRAWKCSDQGFFGDYQGLIIYDHCWSFANGLYDEGYTHGIGCGFKPGYINYDIDPLARIIKNCVSAYNQTHGFHENTRYKMNMQVYNNIAYKNGRGIFTGYGFYASFTYTDALENINYYRNNIGYANKTYDFAISLTADHSYNSMDTPYTTPSPAANWMRSPATVNDLDFLSVDSTGITAERQADGSFPDNDCYNYFLRLASTSDLIDAGVDVGLDYEGSAPDMGPFEYDPTGLTALVVFTTNAYPSKVSATITSNVYDDGGFEITERGVCWSESENPTTDDNKVTSGSGTGVYTTGITGLASGTTYHVRAYAINAEGTGYGNDIEFTTKTYAFAKNVKWVFCNGKWIRV